jgi:hypothetical protein
VLEQEAAYLVTAPGWPYHLLSQMEGVRPLYDTRYPWTREQGLNNMVVYKLDAAGE